MDVGCWCNSGHRHAGWTCNFSEATESDGFVPFHSLVTESKIKTPIWRLMWRKIKKEKRKILERSNSTVVHLAYDICSYAQNFDEGSMWDDSDYLSSRSFSARFAVPSRIFETSEGLLD